MVKTILRWLAKNLGMLLTAFVLAIIVWVSAVVASDPNEENVLGHTIPVEIIGVYVPALADAPLTIELERREATCRAAAAMLPQCIHSTVGVTRAEEFERTEHAIVRAAHEAGASAIAMGTHGRGRSLHLFLGSVALGTVERSDLPVILCGQ
jgi:nucleotide-binding universal stress UspA family protein